MSELSPQISPEEAQNYSNELAAKQAALNEYKAAHPVEATVETTAPHLQLVKNETTSPLPQRVRGGETAAAETPAVEATQSDTEIEAEPETTDLGLPQRVDSSNAGALLETLRASQDFKEAVALEQGSEAISGAHVDTTVEVDSDSRVPGEHRAGKHVASAEVTSDSEIQTGGSHRAESEVSVESPIVLTPEKHRKFGSILRFLRKRPNNK